jgi:hypothetical protein
LSSAAVSTTSDGFITKIELVRGVGDGRFQRWVERVVPTVSAAVSSLFLLGGSAQPKEKKGDTGLYLPWLKVQPLEIAPR